MLAGVLGMSQTYIPAGSVNGQWSLSESPYIIDGDIVIQSADSLHIEAGLEVLCSDKYAITILDG